MQEFHPFPIYNKRCSRLLLLQQVTNFGQQLFLCRTLRLFRGGSGLFLLAVQLVDALEHQEDTEGDDEEVDDVLNETTVGEYRCSGFLCGSQRGVVSIAKIDEQIGKVDAASSQADDRHEHVVDQRGDNLSKRAADDDTDSHVHYVALHGKLFEFTDKSHSLNVFNNYSMKL